MNRYKISSPAWINRVLEVLCGILLFVLLILALNLPDLIRG